METIQYCDNPCTELLYPFLNARSLKKVPPPHAVIRNIENQTRQFAYTCGLAEFVTTLAKVILISVDHHCAAYTKFTVRYY
jgi:hypothetical protein